MSTAVNRDIPAGVAATSVDERARRPMRKMTGSSSTLVASGDDARSEGGEEPIDSDPKSIKPPSYALMSPAYKAALHRIDVRLLPYTITLYFLAQVDKHAIGQAHARDLDADLHLHGNQYATLLSLYFPAYLVLHYVAGIFLRQLRPRYFLPAMLACCGLTTLSMCRADSFSYMAVGRLLLGMFEAALTPTITILYASWYPVEHIAMRLMLYHLAAPIAGVASAFVCAAFFLIDGWGHLEGWQWMFCVEGAVTALVALPGLWLLPNFIEQDAGVERYGATRWQRFCNYMRPSSTAHCTLLDEQRGEWAFLLQRQSGPLRRVTPFTWSQVLRPFVDVKIYLYTLIALSGQVASSNMANFAPAILRGMGYSGGMANVLSAGPLGLAVVVMLGVGLVADRRRIRGPLLLPCLSIVALGQLLIVLEINNHCTYAAMYLVAAFSAPCSSILTAWCAGNVGAQYTKMAAMSVLMLAHTASTLLSVNMFPPTDAPHFRRAHLIGLVGICTAVVATTALFFLLRWCNAKRDREFPLDRIDDRTLQAAMQVARPADAPLDDAEGGRPTPVFAAASAKDTPAAMSDDEARAFWRLTHLTNAQFAQLGDRHPGVRYVL